jgi:hypothetical protein
LVASGAAENRLDKISGNGLRADKTHANNFAHDDFDEQR